MVGSKHLFLKMELAESITEDLRCMVLNTTILWLSNLAVHLIKKDKLKSTKMGSLLPPGSMQLGILRLGTNRFQSLLGKGPIPELPFILNYANFQKNLHHPEKYLSYLNSGITSSPIVLIQYSISENLWRRSNTM